MLEVVLAWPVPALSPNTRLHWSKRAAAKKVARKAAWAKTLHVAGLNPCSAAALRNGIEVTLSMEFCPPTNARRDMDNSFAACKALIDGISDAIHVNDSRFRYSLKVGEPVKGGAVRVKLEPYGRIV